MRQHDDAFVPLASRGYVNGREAEVRVGGCLRPEASTHRLTCP